MNTSNTNNRNYKLVKYYGYSFFANVAFFFPILVLFFSDSGMSFSQIFILEMVGSISMVIFEVPTGALADYFGKKKSIALGTFIEFISCILFATNSSFVMFLLARLVWAIGGTMTSGANTALLYDISCEDSKDNFSKHQGNAQFIGLMGITLSSLIGGFLASYSLKLTFLLTGVTLLICTLLILTIDQTKAGSNKTSYLTIIKNSVKEIHQHSWLLWIILFGTFLTAIFSVSRSLSQVYMLNTGTDIKLYGVAAMIYFLAAAITAKVTYIVEKTFGNLALIMDFFLFLLTFILVALIDHPLGFLLFTIIFIAQSMKGIIINNKILKASNKDFHSTILSFKSLIERLLFSILSPIIGYSLDIFTFTQTILILTFILILSFTLLLISYKSIQRKTGYGI